MSTLRVQLHRILKYENKTSKERGKTSFGAKEKRFVRRMRCTVRNLSLHKMPTEKNSQASFRIETESGYEAVGKTHFLKLDCLFVS